ncbi:acyltransferase [Mesobacillus maritimus]|uniref:acyltransferase n=1 Tax=Mesobacillus maritimus TaxID=1643336 RepID=UPI00203D76FC|nr:acyltransferase [Mesobacillus maritimus]
MIFQKIIHRFLTPIATGVYTQYNRLKFKLHQVEVGTEFKVRGSIYIKNYGKVRIGNNVTMNSAGWANPIGLGDRMYFQIMQGAIVEIGNDTGISNTAITSAEAINIGNNVLIGAGCKIFDMDFHPLEAKYRYGKYKDNGKIRKMPVVIEDGVFIGGGSFILKGSHIGKDSIIGAGSVVSGRVPPNEVWAGNPAKFIRYVDEPVD